MKITAIKKQQKRQDRYSIYVDEKYAFSLSESDLIVHGLHAGQEFSPAELAGMEKASLIGKAYDRALNYISIRPRSEHELEQYLRRKDYDSQVVEVIKDKLRKLELLDDADFARKWVDWRQATAPRSKRRLRSELAQKKIAPEIIDEALADISASDQLRTLQELIERKKHRYGDERKLMAYLANQGYPYDLIKQALGQEE